MYFTQRSVHISKDLGLIKAASLLLYCVLQPVLSAYNAEAPYTDQHSSTKKKNLRD